MKNTVKKILGIIVFILMILCLIFKLDWLLITTTILMAILTVLSFTK